MCSQVESAAPVLGYPRRMPRAPAIPADPANRPTGLAGAATTGDGRLDGIRRRYAHLETPGVISRMGRAHQFVREQARIEAVRKITTDSGLGQPRLDFVP